MCLTFSHDSAGLPSRRNQTSAEAGCFSGASHIKLRLFFDQDIEIFCGASYLTVEDKQREPVLYVIGFKTQYILYYFTKYYELSK